LKLKRYWETGKTVLIFVLIASAVFLAGKTGYFDELIESAPALSRISGWFGSLRDTAATPAPPGGEISFAEAARPVYGVVTGIGGHHCGIKYDGAQLASFYSDTSNLLGEALGSSSLPQEISEETWRAALTSAGIYFDYLNPVPLSAMTRWLLGSDTSGWDYGHSVRRICISGSDDGSGVILYYMDSKGGFHRAQTAVTYSALADCMAKYLPNDAKFAFELGEEFYNVDPYAIILPGTGRVPAVSLSNPVYDKVSPDDILFGFGINPNLASLYHESGAVVYMTENCSLRIYDSGLIVYKATGDTGERLQIKGSGDKPRTVELLEGARAFASVLIGGTTGAAELYFTGLNYDSDGGITLTFDYFVGGIPVRLKDCPHAAIIKITQGVITEARLCFRTFASTGANTPALPDLQAAVLAGKEGGEPVLEFFESGGTLSPQWTLR